MSYLNEAVPADSEAVTLGASRIRAMATDLNALISQVFEDAGTFLPGWIQAAGAAGGASLFAAGAIQSADIGDGQVGTAQMADSAVTTDILAAGAVTAAKLVSGFVAPTASVATASCQTGFLSADTAGQALMAAGYILPIMMGFSTPQIAVGSYAGSNTESPEVNTLSFEPKILILTNSVNHGIGIAFLSEVGEAGNSTIHASFENTEMESPFLAAVHWVAPTGGDSNGGFIINSVDFDFNQAGSTHTYVAISF